MLNGTSQPHVPLSLSRIEPPMSYLNIYPQPAWHDPALIVGTVGGIEALRDACQQAIDNGVSGAVDVLLGDGEGYSLLVAIQPSEVMPLLPTAYTEDFASDNREEAARRLGEILSALIREQE